MKAIEFSAPMMLALLRRQKTMTRRLVKPQPAAELEYAKQTPDGWVWWDTQGLLGHRWPPCSGYIVPRYQPGELAWAKEPLVRHICPHLEYSTPGAARGLVVYDADNNRVHPRMLWRWARSTLPARHCPREASRATVRITSVQVERVQEITEGDAWAESFAHVAEFSAHWDLLHGDGAWERNEWVWVYGFEVVP